jgi:MFS family permease
VRTVSLASAGFGAAMLALAVAPNQPMAFAIGAVMGFTSISFMTSSTAIVQLRADPMMRGRVLALQAIVFLGSTPIGGPIVGTISERYGARYGLALGAFATLGAAAYGLLTVRRAAARPLTEAVSAAALADAATDLGEGPVVVGPSAPQPAT